MEELEDIMSVNYQKVIFILRSLGTILLLTSLMPTSIQAATFTWQSPYIGAYLGGGFGNNHTVTNVGSISPTSYFSTTADINAVNNSGNTMHNPTTLIAGIQAGHDWIWQQMLYGVVIDYSALPLNSSTRITNVTYPDNSDVYSLYTSMNTNWLFTLRGRLGYRAIPDWPSFLYITGGMAITQLKVKNNFSDNSSLAGAGGNYTYENEIGWTAGVGVELAAVGNTSVNMEYLYFYVPSVKTMSNISNTNEGFGIPAQSLTNSFSTTGKFHASLITIGLNYRFNE